MTDCHTRVLCPATEISLECANVRDRQGRTLLLLATYSVWYTVRDARTIGQRNTKRDYVRELKQFTVLQQCHWETMELVDNDSVLRPP